jgi:hypothetical protein
VSLLKFQAIDPTAIAIRRHLATAAIALLLVVAVARCASGESSSMPVEQKIDSQLLSALRQRSGNTTTPDAPTSAVKIDADGRTTVDIKATVSDALLQQIKALGGNIISSFPQYHAIRASIPMDRLPDLASLPDVSFIRPAEMPIYNQGNRTL